MKMRHFYLTISIIALIVMLWPSNVLAVHNLLLNGQTTLEIAIGDSFTVTLDFEQAGATATGMVWFDVNENGQIDEGDISLSAGDEQLFVDGGEDDMDGAIDGHYMTQVEDFLPIPGQAILWAEDNGVSDEAILIQLPVETNYSISGTVIIPDHDGAGIIVGVMYDADFNDLQSIENEPVMDRSLFSFRGREDGLRQDEMMFMVISGADGSFQVYLPDDQENVPCLLFAMDIFGMAEDYVPPPMQPFTANGHLTGFELVFVQATAWFTGNVGDNLGRPVSNIDIEAINPVTFTWTVTRTDEDGNYTLGVLPGSWWLEIDLEQEDDDYMLPPPDDTPYFISEGQTISVDYMLFVTDAFISGQVFFEGLPVAMNVGAFNDQVGSNQTMSDETDGVFELAVSTLGNDYGGYSVFIADELPPGYFVLEQYNGVMSGTTGLTFNV
ncbi:MAG: carboxypeptidase regulatory-like domain-containing protein, partial [Planctomycetes bacterium]|nr:carboxypeptidase regulatory-like domain-containing protein [Planctomycetota bacterium]